MNIKESNSLEIEVDGHSTDRTLILGLNPLKKTLVVKQMPTS